MWVVEGGTGGTQRGQRRARNRPAVTRTSGRQARASFIAVLLSAERREGIYDIPMYPTVRLPSHIPTHSQQLSAWPHGAWGQSCQGFGALQGAGLPFSRHASGAPSIAPPPHAPTSIGKCTRRHDMHARPMAHTPVRCRCLGALLKPTCAPPSAPKTRRMHACACEQAHTACSSRCCRAVQRQPPGSTSCRTHARRV